MNTLAVAALIAISEIDNGIPTGLLQAICEVESNLNPIAVVEKDGVGGRASYGVCQVQHRTARHFSPSISTTELLDPFTNARIAALYLKWQYKRYGRWDRAVVAYNRGSSTTGVNSYSRKVDHAQRMLLSARTSTGLVHQGCLHHRKQCNRKDIHLRKPTTVADREVQTHGCTQTLLETNLKSDGGTVNGRAKRHQDRAYRSNSWGRDYPATGGDFLREDLAYTD